MKKTIALLVVMIMVMSCTACVPSNTRSEDALLEAIKSFKNEEYGFTVPDLAWGMSTSELDALPQHSLGALFGSTAPLEEDGQSYENTMYLSDQLAEIEGNKGTVMYQFLDDRLIGVSITFKTNTEEMRNNDLTALYDALTAQAEGAFGATMEAKDDHLVQVEGYRGFVISSRTWAAIGAMGETMLHITKMSGQGEEIQTVSISFSCLDAGKNPLT